MSHDIFISYSNADKTAAESACKGLETAGLRCWMAPRDVAPGADWAAAIVEAIAGAKVVVLVFSRHTSDSRQIANEIERATTKATPVIPLRIDDVLPRGSLGYFLGSQHWFDAHDGRLEARLPELAAAVRTFLAAPDDTSGRRSAGLTSLAKLARPRLSRAQRFIRAASAAAGIAALLLALWIGGRSLEASRLARTRQLAVAEVMTRVTRLDHRVTLVDAQFAADALQQKLVVPAVAGLDTEVSQQAAVLRERAAWLRQVQCETPIAEALSPAQRDGLTASGCSALAIAEFERQAAAVEVAHDLFREHCGRHARLVEIAQQPGKELHLTIANLSTQRLAVASAALQCHVAALELLSAAGEDVAFEMDGVVAGLAALRTLEPRRLLTTDVRRAAMERLESLAAERNRQLRDGLLIEAEQANQRASKQLTELLAQWDNFEPRDGDDYDRLFRKAHFARGCGHADAAAKLFEAMAPLASSEYPNAVQFARLGAAYTLASWRDQESAIFVEAISADSPAAGVLRIGDIIETVDGIPVPNSDAFVAAMKSRPLREVRLGIVREHAVGKLVRESMTIQVPADSRIRIRLTEI